jgi:transcription elongation factor Elf1
MNIKANNRIKPSEVLRAVIVALNQEPKVSNNWNNFSTCLFCGESSKGNTKFGLSINNNSFYINCFSCGFNTEKKEDYQRVYDSLGIFQDNNYSKYDKEIIKEATAPAPKISLEKISEILTDLNNSLVQSERHKSMFYAKRGFNMPPDYKSISGYHDIKYLYDKYPSND